MPQRIDHTGKKYNHLTLLQPIHAISAVARGRTLWTAVCDCGNKKEVCAREVRAGRVKTCGNCEYHRRLTLTKQRVREQREWLRYLYSKQVRESVRRGVPWELSIEQYNDLITKSCATCGTPPANRVQHSRRRYTPVSRIDYDLGYTVTNCLPGCLECIRIRGQYNLIDFLDYVSKMLSHTQYQISKQA